MALLFIFLLLFWGHLISTNNGEFLPSPVDNNREPIILDGDVILGGLFNVHRRSRTTENGCGNIDANPGYQYFASAIFAIKEINDNPTILRGIKLGARIYDTCRSQTIGADGAKEIIIYTLLQKGNSTPPLAGVIGPFRSDVAVAVANLLRVFNIPQVSFGATTTELSNKQIYGYFLRTVPPNSFQGRALVDVVRHFGWSYIMTVYSVGKYGKYGMDEVYSAAKKTGVCIASKIELPAFPTDQDFKNTIKQLLDVSSKHKGSVNVVVMFCIQRDNTGLVRAAKEILTDENRFIWVASNSWGAREPVTKGSETGGEGAITLNFIEGKVERFKSYLLGLTPQKYNSTWFHEFWQMTIDCRLRTAQRQWNSSKDCKPNDKLPHDFGIAPVRVAMNAVYAAAYALDDMHRNLCNGQPGMCPAISDLKREIFLKYLKNVTFPDSALNFTEKFNRNGEVDGKYSILNFRKLNGKFSYLKVGRWGGVLKADDSIEGGPTVNDSLISWKPRWNNAPRSFCSSPCSSKQITQPAIANPNCCWRCDDCEPKFYILNDTCKKCPLGHRPDVNLSSCYELPVYYPTLSGEYTAMIITAIIVIIGIIGTLFTAGFFLKHRDNRVIKASGRELSIFLFTGTFFCYISALLYMTKPTVVSCGTKRFFISISMTICYAPVLLRTNRIFRIFKAAQKSVTRPSLISPTSQVIMCLSIIGVQALITCVWFLSDPPSVMMDYQYDDRTLRECGMNNTTVAINLCYNILLMLISTGYAFRTRNFPRNFNEAKYIGITMYISCSVWIIFIPCYLNAVDSIWKSSFAAIALVAIATVTLLGLMVPRVFLVLQGATVGPETMTMTMSGNNKHNEMNSNVSGGRAGRYQTKGDDMKLKEDPSRARADSIHPTEQT